MMTAMIDTIVLLVALAAFGGLLIGWMLLPIPTEAEEVATPSGRPATVPV
jgi:hypothetical protein